jgi:hypothetical protein
MKNKIVLFLLCFAIAFAIKAQSVAAPEKMNILYIGVDNPVLLSLGNVPQQELDITLTQGKIEKIPARTNAYMVRVNTPGDMTITVSHKGKVMGKHIFRVKRIPNPVARLPLYDRSNEISSATLRTLTGLVTLIENFDFDVRCPVNSFTLLYKSTDCKTTKVENEGATFNPRILELIKKARVGDIYIFQDIKAKCPEDINTRLINDIAISIKP